MDYTIYTGKDAWNQVGTMAFYNGSSELPKNWYKKNSSKNKIFTKILGGMVMIQIVFIVHQRTQHWQPSFMAQVIF